jgi:hypothetical protein
LALSASSFVDIYYFIGVKKGFYKSLCRRSGNYTNNLTPYVRTIFFFSFIINISEMVCTRTTNPGRTNPPPETKGPSNNEQMAALEARIAQMFKDMEALNEQNALLLRQILEESNMNEGGDEHGSQSNGRKDGDLNPEGRGFPGTANPGKIPEITDAEGAFTNKRRRN